MSEQRDELAALNDELRMALDRRVAAGVVDIKGHVEVTGTTEPSDVKRALVCVFDAVEAGTVQRLPLAGLGTFDAFYKAHFAPSA